MISLTLPNIITIALISVAGLALVKFGLRAAGISQSIL